MVRWHYDLAGGLDACGGASVDESLRLRTLIGPR